MTSEFVVAWASAVIALLALGVAVWQGHLMRQHNRFSLRPHLAFRETISATNNPQFVLELQNNGIGPAIIKEIQVLLDEKRLEYFEAPDWLAILDLIGLKGQAITALCAPEEFLAAGQSLPVLKYDSSPSPMDVRRLRAALRRIEINVAYRSAYGDKYAVRFHIPISISDCYESAAGG